MALVKDGTLVRPRDFDMGNLASVSSLSLRMVCSLHARCLVREASVTGHMYWDSARLSTSQLKGE